MQASDLAFYTTQELIAELMKRQTFYGVIVHSADENRRAGWGDERMFKVHCSRQLDPAQAGRLLDSVAGYINANID